MRNISCGGMCTAPWWQLSAPLEMAPMTAFGAFFDYGSYNLQIKRNGKNFIVRLTTFKVLDLRLSLDCELPIKIF